MISVGRVPSDKVVELIGRTYALAAKAIAESGESSRTPVVDAQAQLAVAAVGRMVDLPGPLEASIKEVDPAETAATLDEVYELLETMAGMLEPNPNSDTYQIVSILIMYFTLIATILALLK